MTKLRFFPRLALAIGLLYGSSVKCSGQVTAAIDANPDPYANETSVQRDTRMRWWREARFGMFIHWGVYSVPAGTYNGKQISGIGEWIMNRGKIPVAEYREYAKQFNPVKFDADAWVKLARDAGMKYIVITSKHHDGFAMFNSQVNDWNIVKGTPYGRDPLKDLAAACRKYGLKLGFYYSQAQDWNNGGSANGGKWDPAQQHDMDDYLDRVAVPQMKEILSNYGEFPAVLWWDTPTGMNKQRADKLITLLKLKPGIIHNNRLGGGYKGDTETPEQFIPATGFPGRDWETCMTMNGTWGFKSYDQNWKSTETIIRNLVDIASKGGNYLLNVGPTSEGLIPEPSVERLQAVGAWMKVNSEAIYATTASPFKRLPWGRCTKKVTVSIPTGVSAKQDVAPKNPTRRDTTLYFHVFNWPADGKLMIPGLKNKIESATLLATGAKLSTTSDDQGATVTVPSTAPDPISSTVVVQIKGDPEIGVVPIAQESDGSIRLMASEADLHGALRYESGGNKDNIGYWTDANDWASWKFQVDRPGKFQITVETAALAESGFQIELGERKMNGVAPNTGDYSKFRRTSMEGSFEIAAPGSVTLSIRPVKEGWTPINLRSVTLKPLVTNP
jgi:alpha-L-fucosidase